MYCHDPMASCRCNVGHETSFWKTSTTIDSLESWTLSKPETAMQRMMLWFAQFLFTTRASESHRSVLRWRWEAIPGHPRSPRWLLRREDLALRKSTRKSKDSYVTMCNNEKLQNSQDIRDVTLQYEIIPKFSQQARWISHIGNIEKSYHVLLCHLKAPSFGDTNNPTKLGNRTFRQSLWLEHLFYSTHQPG